MSTRCFIGIKNSDGTVRAVYNHFDGYITGGVGDVLHYYYKDVDKINKLLDLGDMSEIGREPIGYWPENEFEFGIRDSYSGERCKTYRERGESNIDAKIFGSEEDFLNCCSEDFTYLYKDGEWYVREWDDELEPLDKYYK